MVVWLVIRIEHTFIDIKNSSFTLLNISAPLPVMLISTAQSIKLWLLMFKINPLNFTLSDDTLPPAPIMILGSYFALLNSEHCIQTLTTN